MTSAAESAEPLPIFADVDTGVDDAMALAYLFASDDARLVGIACTAGNVPADQVCVNNLGLLELCGVSGVPVSKGVDKPLSAPLRTAEDTHGLEGLGYARLPASTGRLTEYDAAEAWVRAAHEHPGELIGLVTGPLTNFALAMRMDPSLPSLLRRLVVMGGSFDYRGNTTPVAEWNVFVDPEAAAEVFNGWVAAWGLAEGRSAATREMNTEGRSAATREMNTEGRSAATRGTGEMPSHLPIVLGLNLTENVAMTPSILSRLAEAADSATTPMSVLDDRGTYSSAANPLIRVLEDAMRFYFEFHFDQGEGYLAHLHDPLAAAVALDPDLVRYRQATVAVELTGVLTRGMTVADWDGRWGRYPNAQVGVEVDPDVFFDRFIGRVGPFAAQLT